MDIIKSFHKLIGNNTSIKSDNQNSKDVKKKTHSAYEKMADKYSALIDHKPHNAYYDRPNTLSLIEKPKGKIILDAACGPGKYAEVLMKEGAKVTGFDFSQKMIEHAKNRNREKGDFYVHDLTQPFDKLIDESFDVVLCALALHYVKDWTNTIKEFHRVLKPNGHLVISIEHAFHVEATWSGFGKPIDVNSYRRPLSASLSPLTENGFVIDKLIEPRPTEDFKRVDPLRYNKLMDFPSFLCIRAIKR